MMDMEEAREACERFRDRLASPELGLSQVRRMAGEVLDMLEDVLALNARLEVENARLRAGQVEDGTAGGSGRRMDVTR